VWSGFQLCAAGKRESGNAAVRRDVPEQACREFWPAHESKGASSLSLSFALSRLGYPSGGVPLAGRLLGGS